ncbi:MAG: hypothetical protein ACKV22_40600 [Bryobacteraceae bacterium]
MRRHLVTIVMSEQTLPDGDWIKIQRVCRSLPTSPELIVLSAEGGFFADTVETGASDVMRRPLTAELILGAVALGYLRWHRSTRQAVSTHPSVDAERLQPDDSWPNECPTTTFDHVTKYGPSPVRNTPIQ